MAEYIERDAALAFQNELEPVMCKSIHSGGIYSATRDDDLVRFISAIPAADVVPVVRCEYCGGKRWCNFRQWLGEDGYCSRGRVKDGDE